jgi:hypothetical protein
MKLFIHVGLLDVGVDEIEYDNVRNVDDEEQFQ